MSIIGAINALRRKQRQSLIGLIPVLSEPIPVPLTACIDITASPYNCAHNTDANPSPAVLDANRDGLQAAINAAHAAGGAKLCAPAGYDIPFSKNATPGTPYGVVITSTYPIAFEMEGVTLRPSRASGANDFYGIQVLSTGGVRFKGITFSQRGMFVGTEQQHMVQLGNGAGTGATGVDFINCKFVDGSGGDGIRLLGFGTTNASLVQDVRVLNCTFLNCDRSGVCFQRGVRRALVQGCFFQGTGDQAIDYEPTGAGTLGDTTIVNNTIVHTNATAAVTLTGQGDTEDDFLNRTIFANNNVQGRVVVRKGKHVLIQGNRIVDSANGAGVATLGLSNNCVNVDVIDNYVRRTTGSAAGEVIAVTYDAEVQPKSIRVAGNRVVQETNFHGIKIDSVLGFILTENKVQFTPADTTYSGIIISNDGDALGYANGGIVEGNVVEVLPGAASTGNAGVLFISGATGCSHADISDNYIQGTAYGVRLDLRGATPYATGWACLPIIDRNTFASVTNPIGGATYYRTGGSTGAAMSFVGSGDPEATVPAPVGSTYQRTSNGAVYRKTSGTGNTGWVTP